MYQLEYQRQALKTLLALPRDTARLITADLQALAQSGEHVNARKPLGSPTHRLQSGQYRVLYTKGNSQISVWVVRETVSTEAGD